MVNSMIGNVTKSQYQRGLDVYSSQFRIPRKDVASWFVGAVGERFGEQAILAGGGGGRTTS